MSLTRKQDIPTIEGNEAPSGGESGSEEEESLHWGGHPLINDVVLKKLFGFVRRFDLKSCRGVSKKWNLYTIPHMRATFKVTFPRHLLSKYPLMNIQRDDFVKLFSSNTLGMGIPVGKFQLGRFISSDDGVVEHFLQLCGETITEIDLYDDCRGHEKVYTTEDVSKLLRSCPNLKVLGFPYNLISRSGSVVKLFPDSAPTFHTLRKISFHHDGSSVQAPEFCPSAIHELLTVASNVSEIVVSVYHVIDVDAVDVVLNCIEMLGRESSIESLHLHGGKTRHIPQLRRMSEKPNGLKLKTLVFSPPARSRRESARLEVVNIALEQIQLAVIFKHTLQHLDLRELGETKLLGFPFMPHLESLAFAAHRCAPPESPERVNLNQYFPVLQRLKIYFEFTDRGYWFEFFSLFDSCPTIKSFIADVFVHVQVFHDILRIFPNLTELKLRLRVEDDGTENEILRQIWSQMTGLESLSISVESLRAEELELDSLFTGIPIGTLKEIRPVVNELEKMSAQERRDKISELSERYCQLPSVRDLTKLRRLNSNVRVRKPWIRPATVHPMSDVTAYLAFYPMNHLNHLNALSIEFTKGCCEILTKETGLETWKFQNRSEKDIIPRFVLDKPENQFKY